jgi:hypothetical protein
MPLLLHYADDAVGLSFPILQIVCAGRVSRRV